MTQTPLKTPQRQPRAKMQGIPVRSNLRAGIILQIDIPSITAVQQEAVAPATAAAAPAATV